MTNRAKYYSDVKYFAMSDEELGRYINENYQLDIPAPCDFIDHSECKGDACEDCCVYWLQEEAEEEEKEMDVTTPEEEKVAVLPDSGARREFETGAVRDIQQGKGRCDLLPLNEVAFIMDPVFEITKPYATGIIRNIRAAKNLYIEGFKEDGHLVMRSAILHFILMEYNDDLPTAMLELSKHFESGAIKYGDDNWKKGIPAHCYIDSALRHFFKYLRGDTDEPHNRAFMWNLICCMWEVNNHGWS